MAGTQKRAQRPRSTRGCHTCRIRHLKCDERFPCRRCLSSGWQCDGPRGSGDRRGGLIFRHERPDAIKRFSTKPLSGVGLSPVPWLTDAEERRAFDFYIQQAAPLLSSVLDAELWSSLIPRLAETDATVRYSMLAISHFCEHPIRSEEAGIIRINPLDSRHLISLRWQARALSIEKSQPWQVNTAMLILKCILLACQEFQQNKFPTGWHLARTAFTLASPLMTSGCEHRLSGAIMSDEIIEVIVPTIMRNACLLFNAWDPPATYSTSTQNLDELETTIFHYLCMVFASIKDVYTTIIRGETASKERMHSRMRELEATLRSLEVNIAMLSPSQAPQQPLKCQALREYCNIGIYWLNVLGQLTDQSPDEENFLQVILDETNEMKSSAHVRYPTAAKTTYFDSFIIGPPAYFLTIFTKSASMRLEALQLLRKEWNPDVNATLIAIVGTNVQLGESFGNHPESNSVYQIYYGSSDRDRLLYDTYNETTAPT